MKLCSGTAVITGASAGLGAEFARQLAKRGMNVILVARRIDRLDEVASEVRSMGRSVETIQADLQLTSDRAKLQSILLRPEVCLLVNNAGYGKVGPFEEMNSADATGQVNLNCTALTDLAHMAFSIFKQRGTGGIFNIGSIAGFLPLPNFSIYAATKSFVQSFSEALAYEGKRAGVQVSVLCPGPTKTEFGQIAGHTGDNAIKSMSAQRCIEIAIEGFEGNKTVIIPGFVNKVITWCQRCLPNRLILCIASKVAHH